MNRLTAKQYCEMEICRACKQPKADHVTNFLPELEGFGWYEGRVCSRYTRMDNLEILRYAAGQNIHE